MEEFWCSKLNNKHTQFIDGEWGKMFELMIANGWSHEIALQNCRNYFQDFQSIALELELDAQDFCKNFMAIMRNALW